MHLRFDDAAEVACTWLSLIGSARHAGLDSEEYLRDLCRVLPKELQAPLGKITIPPPPSQSL
ncbi:hypothetical protein LZC95_48870 [Pendulispora brunnea]|uniref:Transposase IS66 C-terminal domain-containing protein n=2 Tax=Pendulispora brunnea TaxID=2905690 RepID=A0ABZ2K6P1_9BACT